MICDGCADDAIALLEQEGYTDSGDTNDYPQYASSSESDCPDHCGHCGEFLENDLTSDGADYVIAAVRENMEEGRHDSIACTVWREYYTWLDFPVWGICDDCGEEGFLDNNDVCEGACAWEG
jgi:hypothetical protein